MGYKEQYVRAPPSMKRLIYEIKVSNFFSQAELLPR